MSNYRPQLGIAQRRSRMPKGQIDLSKVPIADAGGVITADNAEDALQELAGGAADVYTLVGVTYGDTDLGTFTGNIIADNSTVKVALQDLETEADDVRTLTGTAIGDTDLGTFTGSQIPDNTDIKTALQTLETQLEVQGWIGQAELT